MSLFSGQRYDCPSYSQIVRPAPDFKELEGKTLKKVERIGDDALEFYCTDGSIYWMGHVPDCCESVYISDIVGDLDTLLNVPIITADERTYEVSPDSYDDEMWTFYCLRTIKGSVDMRWNGSSNGYYSISVDFEKLRDNVEIVND
jgi:hypothetical protein